MSLGNFLQGLIIGCLLHLQNSDNARFGMKLEVEWEVLMKSTKFAVSLYLTSGIESPITPRSCDFEEGVEADRKSSLGWY
ncbi:unnamed protein product [Rodentolepis nana]|uniref:Secreted protein n=1 Tax=Rodentolepis nana TaxID=102285 RepID=A0A0R3TCZ9_RODNA|nr:unnamed protein product [Rodentolepis nana]